MLLLVMALLTGLVAWAVLPPLAAARSGASSRRADPLEDRRRALLRQLRDLDDDQVAGKLDPQRHRSLRREVEAEAVTVLRQLDAREGTGELTAGLRQVSSAGPVRPRSGRSRVRRTAVVLVVTGVTVAGTAATLSGAVRPRSTAAPTATASTSAAAPAGPADPLAAAERRVRDHPSDVAARLDLAGLLVDGGQPQAAAVEYLSVLTVQPDNAEANSAMGLLLFQAGHPDEGLQAVDKALAADPNFPEALYAKGLIELMGLKRPAEAAQALRAYQRVAPFGAHRTAVATLLALTEGGTKSP